MKCSKRDVLVSELGMMSLGAWGDVLLDSELG